MTFVCIKSMHKINLNKFQVATNETVRDINSRIMLNLVRQHQPVSRADLMRFSGLQRSTVSVIAGRLIADRWLKEGAVGNLPRGRKPTFLHLNPERCGVIGVDVQPAPDHFGRVQHGRPVFGAGIHAHRQRSVRVYCPFKPPDHGFNPGASQKIL